MQYQTEKFLIVKHLKNFILDLEKLLVNFPRKEFLTKDLVYKEALNILELVYKANSINEFDKRKEIQIDIVAKLSMLDFYIERAYKKKYISEKQCINKANELETITKMVYKWIKNERIS